MRSTMDIEERIQITNHLVQLDMDVAYNQISIALNQRRRVHRRKRWRMKPWLHKQQLYEQYERLVSELEVVDPAAFTILLRVEPAMFRELLNILGPAINNKDTFYRKTLHHGLRLAITLRSLATGDSYHSLTYGFRVAHNTISSIVCEVCMTIIGQ